MRECSAVAPNGYSLSFLGTKNLLGPDASLLIGMVKVPFLILFAYLRLTPGMGSGSCL